MRDLGSQLNSPLSGRVTSRFGGSGKQRSKILIGVALTAAVPLLLSTFAASVTVGTGNLNFGQGSEQAVACDSQVYVSLGQEWHSQPTENDSTAGFFRVKSITVSGLNLVACQNTKLRVRLINMQGKEIALGTDSATVLQISVPQTDQPVSTSDPAVLGLGYLTGDGQVISGVMQAQANLSVAGTSIYDGSALSPQSADITFYLDPSALLVNIDGQTVGRTTVESVNNPKPMGG